MKKARSKTSLSGALFLKNIDGLWMDTHNTGHKGSLLGEVGDWGGMKKDWLFTIFSCDPFVFSIRCTCCLFKNNFWKSKTKTQFFFKDAHHFMSWIPYPNFTCFNQSVNLTSTSVPFLHLDSLVIVDASLYSWLPQQQQKQENMRKWGPLVPVNFLSTRAACLLHYLIPLSLTEPTSYGAVTFS